MPLFEQYIFSPWLTPVRLVSTVNVSGTYFNGTLNNGVGATLTIAASSLTIDGVVVNIGDRILLQNQTSAFQNGIYVVAFIGATVILQRAADQQSIEQFKTGQYVTVSAGTANAGSAFVTVEPLPAQLGINNLTFVASPLGSNLGTAATKAASDNTSSIVASVESSPTITVNDIAVFADTVGSIKDGSSVTAAAGNLQAGYSGTAGTVNIFPATASKGKLIISVINQVGNTNVTLSVNAMHQATTVSIPDPGVSSTNFLLADYGGLGAQTVNTGNFTVAAGNIQAGSAGNAGTLISFPATSGKGSLILAAVNNTGSTNTTISNAAMGQASVISIPDPGTATADFVLAPSALVSGNINKSSGTAGLIVDAGIAANVLAISTITNPDAQSDILTQDFTVMASALATAGKVNIQLGSGLKQYAIRDIKMNKSTGLSGGGGDRLLAVTDGTSVWTGTGITAALLGTPVNTLWGGSGLPLPGSTFAFSTLSVAASNIYFQYTGGTTDFTTGSVIITVTWQRVV